MTRSPDDIFAAQFWAWPDPALKRDAHGRVLFVNAAFLQLFGGSVEAWRGQVVHGWSAPQPGPHPNRFEIRTPAGNGYPEQVYDWLESCGPDGTGFALARNVTAFAVTEHAPPAPQPIQETYQADVQPAHQDPVQQQVTADLAPAQQPALQNPLSYSQAAAAPEAAPLAAAPVAQAPVAQVAQAPIAQAPTAQAPVAQAPNIQQEPAPVEVAAPAPIAVAPQPEPAPVPEPAPIYEVNPHEIAADAAQEERDFQRRALPIETDSAILGNNWRDAVIAKAVGGEEGGVNSAAPTPASTPSGAPAAPDGTIRILLAEDNAINALLTRTLLEADGHSVDTVEDGVLAVEAMKSKSYDMIFMDMRMPNMDGLESTRKIRALPNVSNDLPIVALTANAFDDDRNACFDSGMNDFMTKPVSAEELSEMVVRWTNPVEQKLAG